MKSMSTKADRRPPLRRRLRSLYALRKLASSADTDVTHKFVVFGQSRSGSTLLTELLGSHPDVDCRGEIFYEGPFFPHLYRRAVEKSAKGTAFGFKMHVHQLDSKLRLGQKERLAFVNTLHDDGYRFIYLRRDNVVRHVMSDQLRSAGGATHVRKQASESTSASGRTGQPSKVHVSTEDVLEHMRVREHYWALADELLKDIPHEVVRYERDLADSTQHQLTLDRLFPFLGLDKASVSTDLKRINTKSLQDLVENFEELEAALKGTPWQQQLYTA